MPWLDSSCFVPSLFFFRFGTVASDPLCLTVLRRPTDDKVATPCVSPRLVFIVAELAAGDISSYSTTLERGLRPSMCCITVSV
jgi:hypothetical protein